MTPSRALAVPVRRREAGMTGREKLLDPTGDDGRTIDTTLAPRLRSLRGLTVGLLDNTKPNAGVALGAVARELERVCGLQASVMHAKGYFGTPAEEDVIERIRDGCDFAVAGVGDCGSCSAATVADGILLERAGVPAVSICTDSFLISAQAMAQAYGFPGFEFVTLPHPLASLDEKQIQARVHDALPELLRILGVES
jgi:hypothetical protein